MTKAISFLLMILIPWGSCYSMQVPKSYSQDMRVNHVIFEDNNVVRVNASTFTSTQIVFNRQETILDVEGGDTSSWIVTHHNNLPNMMFLKPTVLNSNTNMTVVTNKHTYYFHLMSNKELKSESTPVYAIKFIYPEEERAAQQAKQKKAALNDTKPKNPKTLNWNYRFSGNTQIMPVHVYDDGTFTYVELQKNQPAPAIFAVDDNQGKESIVNMRHQGNVLVIQRIAPQFTLRHGGLVASVFNSNEIARLKQGRR